jgi:hypothetical protein
MSTYPELLSFLKGKDNPFDLFVAARKPEADFPRYHVASIHEEVLAPLRAVLERFRIERLEWEQDLPRSGVVVVQGIRGIGKTHMVHALQQGGEAPGVVVTPSIYEPHRPFIEYLLHQLVRHFQNETDGKIRGTLELLADALARQVIVQALHGMTETDWLVRNVDGRRRFWSLFLGFGTRGLAERKRLLIADLQAREVPTIQDVGKQHERDIGTLRDIAIGQIEREETGLTIAGQIRRGLYDRLVRTAFGEPCESLYEFLLDGYTQVEAKRQPSREALVDELFQALLELFLLARMPVVFAFDALEALLGDPPDARLCHPFFKGLADVLDSHRGIAFFLFAETGHWQRTVAFQTNYAQHRLQQGVVRVPKYGSVSMLGFPDITARHLGAIVASRVKPLHDEFHETDKHDVPALFPFQEEDLARIAGKTQGQAPTLRQALQALRDRYDTLVLGMAEPAQRENGQPPPPPLPDITLTEELETCWQRELRTAKKKLQDGRPVDLADEIHAGIDKWLQNLIADGAPREGGEVAEVENVALGDHPTYGQLTRYRWTDKAGSQTVGLGLLLGEGAGMPRDLDAKLKIVASSPRPVEAMVLLWPKGADLAAPLNEHFPPATQRIWEQYAVGRNAATERVQLRGIRQEDLACWLALPSWLKAVRTDIDGAGTDVVAHFVAEKTASLLSLATPRS